MTVVAAPRLLAALRDARRSRRARLGRADRRAHRAEPRGLATSVLERRTRVSVDELALLDVGVRPLDQQACVLA
jgi:hypothetical protein